MVRGCTHKHKVLHLTLYLAAMVPGQLGWARTTIAKHDAATRIWKDPTKQQRGSLTATTMEADPILRRKKAE